MKPNDTDIFHAKITVIHREEFSIIVIQKLLHISSLACLPGAFHLNYYSKKSIFIFQDHVGGGVKSHMD